MIDNPMQFLEDVNKELKTVVAMATADFITVNALLKKYYASRKDFASVNNHSRKNHGDTEMKIEAMMGGLQYMDIFSQRMEHLVLTHHHLLNTSLASDFKESFFHLHVFQSMTIELDLLRSISSVKSVLLDVKDVFDTLENAESEVFFSNTPLIKQILQNTIAALLTAGGETQRLPIPALKPEQVRMLNSLYTMESERVVLSWFLNSMPHGTWEQLMHYYEAEINQIGVDNTELF